MIGFDTSDLNPTIDRIFSMAMDILDEEIVRTLKYLGEQCNRRIRDRSQDESWIDHTGNLRSSIGYGVYDHAKEVVSSAFNVVKQGGQGAAEGRKLLKEIVEQYSDVYALVIVAGMSYADYVEACKNKDVLASTEIWARAKVDTYIKKAVEKALRRINSMSV